MDTRAIGGREEGRKRKTLTVGGFPPGLEDQGWHGGHLPHPLGPRKPVGLLGLVPSLPSGAPSVYMATRGIEGRGGEEKEMPMGRGPLGSEDRGERA